MPRHEQQWIAPVAIARAEAAWLEGRHEAAIKETELAYEDANVWALAIWQASAIGAGAQVLDEPVPDVGEE